MTTDSNQAQRIIFIYDGECPFCNKFAALLELKSNIPNLEIKNAREEPSEMPNGYDMDIKGAILLKDNKLLSGSAAINWICTQIEKPSDILLSTLKILFKSKERTSIFFPFLLLARRTLLVFKGVPRKISQ